MSKTSYELDHLRGSEEVTRQISSDTIATIWEELVILLYLYIIAYYVIQYLYIIDYYVIQYLYIIAFCVIQFSINTAGARRHASFVQ